MVAIPAILQAFPGRSRCSIFRDLKATGYLSSYNHAGRFFTLTDVPPFNADGLWQHQGVFFSRHGTLKATVRHLVQTADAGQTHPELQQRLHVRVHNTVLDLVRHNETAREQVDKLFLYVHVDSEVRSTRLPNGGNKWNIGHRSRLGPYEVIEVLLDVIRLGEQQPERVVSHLRDKGLGVTLEQVAAVFDCYGLSKKTRYPGLSSITRASAPSGGVGYENVISIPCVAAVETSSDPCDKCGASMRVQKTVKRLVGTLKHGIFRTRETVLVCTARCTHPSGQLAGVRKLCSKLYLPGLTTATI